MKKHVIFFSLLLFIAIGTLLIVQNQQNVAGKQENQCLASGGGWAPYWDQIDCNGNKLLSNSDLVNRDKTCWCHSLNTCWNGTDCVSRESSTQPSEKNWVSITCSTSHFSKLLGCTICLAYSMNRSYWQTLLNAGLISLKTPTGLDERFFQPEREHKHKNEHPLKRVLFSFVLSQ